MAAPAAGFQSLHPPLAVADHARFFKSWLRRIAPDTHQDQASGDETACRPGGFAAPEERWCRSASNGLITLQMVADPLAPILVWLASQAIRVVVQTVMATDVQFIQVGLIPVSCPGSSSPSKLMRNSALHQTAFPPS